MSRNLCILGVDPGITGAIAFFFVANQDVISVYDMPVAGGNVDAVTLARRLDQLRPDLAMVESVAARPGQGVSSVFKFGHATGCVIGVLGALKIPLHYASPTKWKKHFGLDSDKERSRALALRLWPSSDAFERKRDHGRAEAALLARFAAEIGLGGAH